MFHTKSRKEQLQDHSASLADTAATVADQLRDRVAPAIGQAAENAKEWGQPRVEAARHWAKPRVEHGIEIAAPKLESAVSGLAPKVDTARDKIVDDLLPRVTEAITAWAAASAAAKDEVVARGTGAAAVVSGEAVARPKRKKRGKVLVLLGLLSAAAAGAAAFMKKSAPKDDPWATPLEDPYVAPSTGRHSSAAIADLDGLNGLVGADGAFAPQEAAGDATSETHDSRGEGDSGDHVEDPTSEAVTTPSDNSKKADKPDKGHGA